MPNPAAGPPDQPPCFLDRKHAFLAENVEESGQALIATAGMTV